MAYFSEKQMDDIGARSLCPLSPPPSPTTSFFLQCGVSKNSTHAETKQLRLQSHKTQNAVCLQIVKQESGIADGSVFVVFFFSGETLFFQWLRRRPLLECRNSRCTSRNQEKNSVARLEPVSIFEFCKKKKKKKKKHQTK